MGLRRVLVMLGVVSAVCLAGCHAASTSTDGWAWGGVFLIHTTDAGAHWSQVAIP